MTNVNLPFILIMKVTNVNVKGRNATMENTATELSGAEWEIMRIVWTLGEAKSTEIVHLMQQSKKWTASTIKTLLRRLVAKGALRTERLGRKFIYHPTIAEKQAMEATTTELFAHMCNMKKGQVITNLVAQTTLSKQDISNLQELLQQKASTAPAKVECNCLPETDCDETCTIKEGD